MTDKNGKISNSSCKVNVGSELIDFNKVTSFDKEIIFPSFEADKSEKDEIVKNDVSNKAIEVKEINNPADLRDESNYEFRCYADKRTGYYITYFYHKKLGHIRYPQSLANTYCKYE